MEEVKNSLVDIMEQLAERIAAHEDGVLLECFNKYGYSNEEVYTMIADGRVSVTDRNQKFKDILIDGEHYFTLEYDWDANKLEDSIIAHYVRVPVDMTNA